MDGQEFQDPKELVTTWVKNMNSIVNKMNSTKWLMTDMEPKDTIKLDIGTRDKSETHPEDSVLLEDGSDRYQYQPGDKKINMEIKKG